LPMDLPHIYQRNMKLKATTEAIEKYESQIERLKILKVDLAKQVAIDRYVCSLWSARDSAEFTVRKRKKVEKVEREVIHIEDDDVPE